jgi:putative transposase
MIYRTVEIHWMPQTKSEWRTFTASRKEAAHLWGDLVERHHRIRRRGLTWPSKARWERWAKARYPGLSAQSTQQILATRKVAEAFPGATCYVGNPYNDAAQKIGRRSAQQVSSACNARLMDHLDYKTCGAIQVDEAYTSQTCPVCGKRNKGQRVYCCRTCGVTAPRDVIGSLNILTVGRHQSLTPGRSVPNAVLFVHPLKYPAPKPGRSPGHGACSPGKPREAPARP